MYALITQESYIIVFYYMCYNLDYRYLFLYGLMFLSNYLKTAAIWFELNLIVCIGKSLVIMASTAAIFVFSWKLSL